MSYLITALVVGSAAGIIAVTMQYRRDIHSAYERVGQGSHLLDTPCGPIEYAETGRGPAVLVVHGAGGGFDQGLDFGTALAKHGFRVITMSRFGYLRTPMPRDASAAAQADAHICVLDALGLKSAAVIGASAGAPSATQMAIRHPNRVDALVLAVPAIYAPRPNNAPPLTTPRGTEFLFSTALKSDFIFWAARRVAPRTMVRAILATPPEDLEKVSATERARVAQMLDRILPIRPRRDGLMNDAKITSSLKRYDLENIQAPALAISVADDQFGTFAGARYSAEHIPGARFLGYATGGHIWAGHQEDVIRQIAFFLKQQSDSTRSIELARRQPAQLPATMHARAAL
jgi:pimeloyl-ACP methyl ester carboxylesterase